jgi:protein phosphatase
LIEPETLVAEAVAVESEDFFQLVKRVAVLLEKEEGHVGAMQIDGRLIRLKPVGEAIIVGDLHGDIESLACILEDSAFLKKVQEKKNEHLIFLGDYGDRGSASPEVYYVVLKLKELFPKRVILMRGNHGGNELMQPFPHDLPLQLENKYGEKGLEIYSELQNLFNNLYSAVIVDERFILMHGGFPSQVSCQEDLAYAHESYQTESHLQELLWSDPAEELDGTCFSPRGAGKLFGIAVTEKMLKMFGVKVLIRGHESCPEGYKMNHNGKILTLFSTNKHPYSNKQRAYLKLKLSKKIDNAEQLKQYIKQF